MLTCEDEVFPLGAAELLIGRHPSADIHFSDDEVSRFHALISLRGGRWQIEDAGAANGVLVNGSRITEPKPLKRGDVITELNGQKIKDSSDFVNKVRTLAPGTIAKISVVRKGF